MKYVERLCKTFLYCQLIVIKLEKLIFHDIFWNYSGLENVFPIL